MTSPLANLIREADIVTDTYTPTPAVGRYQGNGRFGAVYSHLGLHAHPQDQTAFDLHGRTQFTHIRHWGRFAFHSHRMKADTTADYLLPLARIYWERPPAAVTSYSQRQDFFRGMLETAFATSDDTTVAVTSWFDPVQRDLAGLRFRVTGTPSPVILAIPTGFVPYSYGYDKAARQSFAAAEEEGQWRITATCESSTPPAVSRLYLRTNARVDPCPEGLQLRLQAGDNHLFVSYGQPVSDRDLAESENRTERHWQATWETSGFVELPERQSHLVWVRSLAYILSSFNDDGLGFVSTNGLTGNMFPFNFAQDLFYVHGVLLATGHVSVAKAWIERFHSMIEGMRAYAKRLWPEVEGIYPPWELPYGEIEGYHTPSVPIFFCYEPHNAGYLSRMAHDTAVAVDDPAWTARYAAPLIREVARFFRSHCQKEADGLWHLHLVPAIGQDEAGGKNQKDYLCSHFAAKFSFQKAVEHGLDDDGTYRRILDEGLAFGCLLSPRGFLYASAGAGEKDFGNQKHPVQLNGLAYLPVEPQPQSTDRVAYQLRYDTTARAKEPFFFGWTLGEFLLASSHLGDAAGWRKDWENLVPSRYTDPDLVQIYETSGATVQSFYITTHGLVAQSLLHNVISDYWGRLEIAPCRVYRGRIRFSRIRSQLGVLVSGEIQAGTARLDLEAWKDCRLRIQAIEWQLRRGEQRQIEIPVV